MIALDLNKQQALDVDPKAIQQINFTADLNRAGNTSIFFILEEAKETIFEVFPRNCKIFVNAILLKCNLIFTCIR